MDMALHQWGVGKSSVASGLFPNDRERTRQERRLRLASPLPR